MQILKLANIMSKCKKYYGGPVKAVIKFVNLAKALQLCFLNHNQLCSHTEYNTLSTFVPKLNSLVVILI